MPHKPFIRTLRAQWLGQQLRALREERGMTLKLVSEHLQRDMSALGRYERADWPIRKGDVIALLDLYGFHHAAERARLLALAEDVWRTDRWDEDYGDVVDSSFIEYPWLESRADKVCCFHMTLVPGLLQTRAYAEAVIRNAAEPEASESMINRWVELRLSRQEVLSKERPLTIHVVIDESVVRRRVGGVQVLRDQLAHLVKLQALPHVRIQIMPFSVALHQGLDGTFWIFHLPEPYPAVAYVESLGGRLYMESPKAERFLRAYDRLSKSALSKDESTALMGAIAEELA
ncbi:transcriptional regulator [Micromonospora humidisoli]|uniref:Helix-turn-helix domain-containing protein n=1 Tax=Micromonospora humidisoli TaxID=2807622 RepID=A0ABS2J5M8_9ACTN|nr:MULTISPECIES: helix-turn-helix transcriptional regulator [Micromonospora]MBM7081862.1 helix-turn-helix domain-containing protein [Micromonospora humidisoli]GHJ09309.1 transcriptional regulator [Micromonospora sp. AKA109]